MASCIPVVKWGHQNYEYDEKDLEYNTKQDIIRDYNPKLFTKNCTNFWNYGNCSYGKKCSYKHKYNHDEQINYQYDKLKYEIGDELDDELYDRIKAQEHIREPDTPKIENKHRILEEKQREQHLILSTLDSITERYNSEDENNDENDDEIKYFEDELSHEDELILDYSEYNSIIDKHPIMFIEEDEEAIKEYDKYLLNIQFQDELEEFYFENKMVFEYFKIEREFILKILPFKTEMFGSQIISIDFGMNLVFI